MRPTSPALDALIGEKISVLDQGFVRVIDYMGNDSSVVQAARVSYGAGTKTTSDDRGLIRYLMRHRHTSCFEMCSIKMHVRLPMFVARQWVRHRTASLNEISARYSVLDAEHYVPEQFRAQSRTNKQGSGDPLANIEQFHATGEYRDAMGRAGLSYRMLLDQGVAREQARMVLPASTYTEWYWKADLHNLLHFLALRSDPLAQAEIREYALVIGQVVSLWVPLVWEAFEDYRLGTVSLSKRGRELVQMLLSGMDVHEGMSGMSPGEWREFEREWLL